MFFVFMFSISATQKDIYNDIFINGNVAGWEGKGNMSLSIVQYFS